jgi:hypothetical protein
MKKVIGASEAHQGRTELEVADVRQGHNKWVEAGTLLDKIRNFSRLRKG